MPEPVQKEPAGIVVGWSGLPWYAARLIRGGIEAGQIPLRVVGTRPEVPMTDLEKVLGQPITWVEWPRHYRWGDLGMTVPALFIHTAWNIPAFNSLAVEVRGNGGTVISMIDNNRKHTFRQLVGALVFRVWIRRRFRAVWVPGKAGREFIEFLGMPPGSIYEGMYGADAKFFRRGPVLAERPREILFVGRMIPKKNVANLAQAFANTGLHEAGWSLRLIGNGPERERCEGRPGVVCEPFKPEDEVSEAMRRARIFVLPSYEEHWGVVLAEAALSGCLLVASSTVGAARDLVTPENGLTFEAQSMAQLEAALKAACAWPAQDLGRAQDVSRSLGKNFGPARWAAELTGLARRFSAVNSRSTP